MRSKSSNRYFAIEENDLATIVQLRLLNHLENCILPVTGDAERRCDQMIKISQKQSHVRGGTAQ